MHFLSMDSSSCDSRGPVFAKELSKRCHWGALSLQHRPTACFCKLSIASASWDCVVHVEKHVHVTSSKHKNKRSWDCKDKHNCNVRVRKRWFVHKFQKGGYLIHATPDQAVNRIFFGLLESFQRPCSPSLGFFLSSSFDWVSMLPSLVQHRC